MQNRCCNVGCFLINSSIAHAHQLATLKNLFCCRHLLFTWKTHCGLKFNFGQFNQSEICTGVSFTTPEVNADNEVTSHGSEILP